MNTRHLHLCVSLGFGVGFNLAIRFDEHFIFFLPPLSGRRGGRYIYGQTPANYIGRLACVDNIAKHFSFRAKERERYVMSDNDLRAYRKRAATRIARHIILASRHEHTCKRTYHPGDASD